ncbi:CLUMA_CG016027, isoform A [Clunio marinus]|uniref:CLUMA_CG016027, isoform A n=1 Tax=Clunio marinus TaxID=568069 RepID=A0A1J1IS17_9DIPT|nr:CLUMA_CG016027, isoform A [Clunio marinus]
MQQVTYDCVKLKKITSDVSVKCLDLIEPKPECEEEKIVKKEDEKDVSINFAIAENAGKDKKM